MARLAALIGLAGVLGLGLWLANFTPLGIDRGPQSSRDTAMMIDLALIALFGLQHSGMARRAWKQAAQGIGRYIPERSAYLLATTLALAVLFAFWKPLPLTVWEIPPAVMLGQIVGLVLIGWAVATLNAHAFLGLQPQPPGLQTGGPYRWMTHPIMAGTLLVLWCVPRMSQGHLLFSAAMTVYAVAGTALESRDLARTP